MNSIFNGLFDVNGQTVISPLNFLICVAVSLLIGLFLTIVFRYRTHCTGSFLLTLAVLPAAVCVVIMMVNGNIGAGVAVAGAFSLVRFRSVPGTAKEIGAIFIAMATGLIAGMGYLSYAVLFALLLGLIWLLYQRSGYGEGKGDKGRLLRITIPEDLDYTDAFCEPLSAYTTDSKLLSAKTSNMGSLFKLTYEITLKDPAKEKELIDTLRCRNGNLEIAISRIQGGENREL